MKPIFPIKLGSTLRPISPQPFHLSALKREEVRIVSQLLGRGITSGYLGNRFLENSTLGRLACLPSSRDRRVCERLIVAKNRANNPILHSFVVVFSRFEMVKPSRPKATMHRSRCSSTAFLRGSYERCFAEDRGSLDPKRTTVDSRSYRLLRACCASCLPVEKFVFLRAHLGFLLCYPPA